MTPKEKAQQLFDKFYFETTITELEEAKDCALIAVNKMLNNDSIKFDQDFKEYWEKVKKELIEL